MSTDKCFCHFNGYAVKDAEARKRLDDIEALVDDLEDIVINFDNHHNKRATATATYSPTVHLSIAYDENPDNYDYMRINAIYSRNDVYNQTMQFVKSIEIPRPTTSGTYRYVLDTYDRFIVCVEIVTTEQTNGTSKGYEYSVYMGAKNLATGVWVYDVAGVFVSGRTLSVQLEGR